MSGCPAEVTRVHRVPTDERRAASSRLKLLEWKAPMVVYMTSGSVSLVLLPQLTALSSAAISPCDESLKIRKVREV